MSITKHEVKFFLLVVFTALFFYICFTDLDFTFLEMNPFTLVNGEPYPLDMRGELDDTAAFKNFKKYIFVDLCFRKKKIVKGCFDIGIFSVDVDGSSKCFCATGGVT